jgi:outer membrane receptor protein involved in Fe transport
MKNYSFSLGVRNIFDTEPPKITAGYTNFVAGNAPLYSGYDIRGRQFYIGVKAGF